MVAIEINVIFRFKIPIAPQVTQINGINLDTPKIYQKFEFLTSKTDGYLAAQGKLTRKQRRKMSG